MVPPHPTSHKNLALMGQTIYRIIMEILFPYPAPKLFGPGSETRPLAPHSAQALYGYRSPATIAKLTKSHKSSCHWTMALILLLWNTAWDLLTHRNVEKLLAWAPAPTRHYRCRPHTTRSLWTDLLIQYPNTLPRKVSQTGTLPAPHKHLNLAERRCFHGPGYYRLCF